MTSLKRTVVNKHSHKDDTPVHEDVMNSDVILDTSELNKNKHRCMGCRTLVDEVNDLGLCSKCQDKLDKGEKFNIPDIIEGGIV